MAFPGLELEESGAFAAETECGEVVSTAVVTLEAPPESLPRTVPPGRAWRLRGMATVPELRGGGIGSAVLRAVVTHVADRGGGVLWCSARTPAVRFYEREGFVSAGEEWTDPLIGPHVMMWRTVDPVEERTRNGR